MANMIFVNILYGTAKERLWFYTQAIKTESYVLLIEFEIYVVHCLIDIFLFIFWAITTWSIINRQWNGRVFDKASMSVENRKDVASMYFD